MQDHFHKNLSCTDGYISLQDINLALEALQDQSIFEGLQTETQVQSYLREKSGGETVLLKQVVLESKIVTRKGVPRIIPKLFGYVVPFRAQLEQLLNIPDILHFIDNPIPSQKGVYRTVTDGLFYKHHPVVVKHGTTTIAILIHMDDAEPCDPLKSKANKNNLRLVYWTIGNIHPDYRSSLKAINLLAVTKARVAKLKGNDFLFEDFISAMKELGTEGIEFNVMGAPRRFYAVLLFGSLDNPAAANLGGFKETHSAFRPCRSCMVKGSEMCDSFRESKPLMRRLEDHNKQVRQVVAQNPGKKNEVHVIDIYNTDENLETDDDEGEVFDETDTTKASRNFGVNGPSILSEAPYFDVTKCLPHDIMHVLNEGIVENVCRLLLRDLCLPSKPRAKPLLKLEELNHAIESMFDFGHLNVSRPSTIEKSHITGRKLKQSAAQMLVLMRLLPFVVHNRLPDAKLELLLKLIRFIDASMAFEYANADINQLGDLVEDFGTAMKKVYPKHKTLKLHCAVHLMGQIILHGPLRQQWNFRYEQMHIKFTGIFPVVRSMKNPAKTAALRHLDDRNREIKQGIESGNYLIGGITTTGAENVPVSSLTDKDILLEKFHFLQECSTISKVNEVVHKGSAWKTGVIFLKDKETNLFCRIDNVYTLEGDIIFTYNILKTEFVPAYNAFEILSCGKENHVINFSELHCKFPILRFSFAISKTCHKSYLLPQKPVECY